MKRILKYTIGSLVLAALLLVISAQVMLKVLALDPPVVVDTTWNEDSVHTEPGVSRLGPNWYGQHPSGLWHAYIEGEPYSRGRAFGLLARQEVVSQEEAFVSQIRRLVPSEWLLNTLKYGVVFFNRNLPEHVKEEFQQEIFGVSKVFSDEYDFIGDKYSRILNYHAAHDIGHALQDLSIVGCSSFAVWDGSSVDSTLIIGRNFDFYMGEDFARNKIVLFERPDSGHAFASITWAGFMGVVSGMNDQGLTVTLNAAKSKVPNGAKTPISLLAREILQYATTIQEAYRIARSRETFVSESLLIGSAKDHAAAIIEKSPDRIDLFMPESDRLICTNHYQSNTFKNDPENLQNIRYSDSEYRFKRLQELIDRAVPVDVNGAVRILRDRKGLNDAELGMGNPKAINQLLAHHGVVFQPEKKLMWVSAGPFQIGEFICYDLGRVFSDGSVNHAQLPVDTLRIEADPFLGSGQYQDFLRYRELKNRLFECVALGREITWNEELEQEFIASNPESYITYSLLGDYYLEQDMCEKAIAYYRTALSKDVASEQERINLEKNLHSCH